MNIHIVDFNFGDKFDYTMRQDCEVLTLLGTEAFENVSRRQDRCFRKGYYSNGEVAVSIEYARQSGFIVTKYYPSGQKLSVEEYYGCATEAGPYREWWENGNLKMDADWIEDSRMNLWYESGHPKRIVEENCWEGLGDPVCVELQLDFWPNGALRRMFRCPNCEGVEDCPPPDCFDANGNPIEC